MEKKAGKIIILIAFITVICMPWLLWLIFGRYTDRENHENRSIAQMPELTVESYAVFLKDLETYIDDRLPFRNTLIGLNSTIDYYLFNKSANKHVVLGKDDWLFYDRCIGGIVLSQYNGYDICLDEDLIATVDVIEKQKEYVESLGKEFVFFIAPNKERIYSDKMQDRYGEPNPSYRALQICNYLKENTDVRVVYPYDELMEAREKVDYNIYYKTDSHWNYIGGYVAAAALLEELGIDMPDVDSEQISISAEDYFAGDLAGMLNMNKRFEDKDYEYAVDGYDKHDCVQLENDFYNVYSFEASGADERSIYVLRDSFSTSMAPYIGSQFSKTHMRHKETYTYEDFIMQDADIFVYEISEDYFENLLNFSIM